MKEHYRLTYLRNRDAETLNKILANGIQKYIKGIIQHDKVRLILGMQGFALKQYLKYFNI